MNDLIERRAMELLAAELWSGRIGVPSDDPVVKAAVRAIVKALTPEAADEITRLREALEPFARCAAKFKNFDERHGIAWPGLTVGDFRAAKAALTSDIG